MIPGAVLSPDELHRYRLDRALPPPELELDLADPTIPQAHGAPVLFVMLNPSTADATRDDPTIRRCTRFAHRLGAGRLIVANLYSYRATRPAELGKALARGAQLVDLEADQHIDEAAREAMGAVVVAWGARPPGLPLEHHRQRIADVLGILRRAGRTTWALGRTASGAPRHPLYLPAEAPLERWPLADPTREQLAWATTHVGAANLERYTCDRPGCTWATTNRTPMLLGSKHPHDLAVELVRHDLEHNPPA